MSKTALIVGASGAVGSEIVRQICKDCGYEKVVVLSRKEVKI